MPKLGMTTSKPKVEGKGTSTKAQPMYMVLHGAQPCFVSESRQECERVKKEKEEILVRSGADITNNEHAVTIVQR